MNKKRQYLLIIFLLIISTNANAFSLGSFFGGSSSNSAGTNGNPYELVIGGATRNDDTSSKYYKFISLVDQNITVHITNNDDWGDTSLALKLYNLNDDGSCDTSSELAHKDATDDNFNWITPVNGGKEYCLYVDDESSWKSSTYDINLTGNATLKTTIADASAHENDNNITFIVEKQGNIIMIKLCYESLLVLDLNNGLKLNPENMN